MPKVLRIINRFNVGGPTYNAAYLTKYLGEEFETRLIGGSPMPGEAHSGYMLDEIGVEYEEISEMSRSVSLMNDLRAFRKIRKIIREFEPDIIHTHAAKAGALGRLAGWMEGVPVIVHTYHGHVFSNYFSSWKSAIVKFIEKLLGKISTAIIVISEQQYAEIVAQFKIVPEKKASIIPLGFDLKRFTDKTEQKRKNFRDKYELQEEDIAIGMIGRIAPVKNHTLFFQSLRELQKHSTGWKAFVIGDGDGRKEMMEGVSDLGYAEKASKDALVIFTSWIKNVDEALAGLDVVILTSISEGTPVSLIEAQATGRVVISTDVGGVRNCILPDQSGFVVKNNPEQISETLEKVINNPALRKQMGEAGQAFVMQKYHYSRLCADVAALYHRLLIQH